MRSIEARALRRVVTAVFEAAGCSPAESARIAESLVDTNVTGHDSHGVIRVARYVDGLRNGEVHAGRHATIVSENPVMAVVDGNDGFGQTIGVEAVELGIRKSQAFGISVIALRHTGHIGRIGQWAEQAAAAGLVSIHFVNVQGSVTVAPFNGVDRRLATNPICIGFPLPGRPPVILDFATSLVAEGKVLVARAGGKPLPEGALITPEGRLSSDPAVLLGDGSGMTLAERKGLGAIRTFGEHKGSGLSFMCEILAGALAGGGAAGGEYPHITNAMLSIYLAPRVFGDPSTIEAEAERFIAFFTNSRPAVPGTAVLAPGDPELTTRAAREREGIPLEDAVWESIVEAAASVGLPRERIEALARP